MEAENVTQHEPGWYPLQDKFDSVPYHSHVIIGSFMIVVLFLAVFGNAIVIVVFLGSRKLRTPSNSLIVNLAVADLLMALSGFPLLIVSSFYGGWVYEPWVCEFYGTTATTFGLMSINTLVFISLDRYVVIVSPQHIHRVTYMHAHFCIFAIWVYSFTWGIMPIFGWNRYIPEGYGTTCSIDYFTREEPHNHFLLCMLLGDYLMPCCLIIYCYVWIFHTVKSHSLAFYPMLSKDTKPKNPLGRSNSKSTKGGSTRSSIRVYASFTESRANRKKFRWTQTEYKIARTVLVVILFYCMAWTPYAVVTLIGQYGDVEQITPTVSMLPAVFAKISTVYNPIVYSLTHPRFKLQLRKMLHFIFPSPQRGGLTSETNSRVSGRMVQRTCDTSDSHSPSGGSFTDSPVRRQLVTQEDRLETIDSAEDVEEITPCLETKEEIPEEILTPIQEFPEKDTVISDDDRKIMKTAMSAGRKKLSQALFIRHTGRTDSDRFRDDDMTKSTWRDISGESLLSVNIEAIKMERIN